jgi:hypothetical protein
VGLATPPRKKKNPSYRNVNRRSHVGALNAPEGVVKRILNVLIAEAQGQVVYNGVGQKSSQLEYHSSLLCDSTIDRD